MNPCSPSRPQALCTLCVRHRPDIPSDPELRTRTVLLDVSTVAKPGACPLAVPRAA